jgi:hypothetical protein
VSCELIVSERILTRNPTGVSVSQPEEQCFLPIGLVEVQKNSSETKKNDEVR